MPHLKGKMSPKGYVVRLYKRVVNVPDQEIINSSMFMTWMNFDCMDIYEIRQFHKYNSSIKLNNLEDKQKYATRQKFFIYCLERNNETDMEEEDINDDRILLPGGELSEFPLITLTMFDIQYIPQEQKIKNCKTKLQDYLMALEKNTEVKGKIYGSLSLYDYVLALRGNDYKEMDEILISLREKLNLDSEIVLNRMYTIPGIDYNNAKFWNFSKLKTSIRLSCTSDITAVWLFNDRKINAAVKIDEIYSILGKYDYDMIGEILSAESFVSLFLSDGSLSAKGSHIHKTNTRFLKENFKQIDEPKNEIEKIKVREWLFTESNKENIDNNQFEIRETHDDQRFQKFTDAYSAIQGLSSNIQESLSRLILRTFQIIISIKNNEISSDLENKLNIFLCFINAQQQEAKETDKELDMVEIEDVYAQLIDIFNLFLDNRVSARISDFEVPQNVLRYSGSSMKVLLSYSRFVDYLMELLSLNKKNENFNKKNKTLKYLAFVTADPVAKITATRFLRYSEKYRLFNIKVPVDLMFEIGKVLPWMTHEAGHFIRAGWKRNDRNAAYYKSVSRAMVKQLIPFVTISIDAMKDLIRDMDEAPISVNDNIEGEAFDHYRKCVKEYFKTVVYDFSSKYDKTFYISYDMGLELREKVEEITDGLQRIYEESIADMFMIEVLGIKKLSNYFEIQKGYFDRLNIDIKELPQENVSRIMAVSVVLTKKEFSSYEDVKKYFGQLYVESSNDQVKPILEKLKNYETYYLLEPLVDFLKLHVKNGLGQLFKQQETESIRKKMEQSYSKLKSGKFEDYIDFVLNFE